MNPIGDGSFFDIYRVISRKDHQLRYIEATGQVFFEDGVAVRLVGTAADVTERIAQSAELRENQAKLALALQNGHMGTWEWYVDKRLVALGPKAFELVQRKVQREPVPEEEIVGLLHPDDRPNFVLSTKKCDQWKV